MPVLTLRGADIKVFINNKEYKTIQSFSLDVDYNEEPIYGIDSPWPQEIAGGRTQIRGSVKGMRLKNMGGLQGSNLRPVFTDLAASPYISIRVQDRSTGEDIVLITNAKVSKESHSAVTRQSYKLNFDFVGQMVLFALDRSF